MRVACVGLGSMGSRIAGRIGQFFDHCLVWDINESAIQAHTAKYNTVAVSDLSELSTVDLLLTCLPASKDVHKAIQNLLPFLSKNTIWVDATSGDPKQTRKIAQILQKHHVDFIDAPVSGFPHMADTASLTTMVGGPKDVLERAKPVLATYTRKIFHIGVTPGSGHAMKAVNNTMAITNLMIGAEGLLCLAHMGIDPEVALQCLNESSGGTFQSKTKMKEKVLNRSFRNTFTLALMKKDVSIGTSLFDEHFPKAQYLSLTSKIIDDAIASQGADVDSSEVVRYIEKFGTEEIMPHRERKAEKCLDYSGQVAVITGAGGGIGCALALKCAKLGMKVVLSDIRRDAIEKTAAVIRETYPQTKQIAVVTDVTQIESVQNVSRETLHVFGRIDLVFLNAGVYGSEGYSQFKDLKSWKWVMDVNVMGVVHGLHAFVPQMIEQTKNGHPNKCRILITGSRASIQPAFQGTYTVSKHAIGAVAEATYFELEELGLLEKIGIHCIYPGPVKTDLASNSTATRPPTFTPLTEYQHRSDSIHNLLTEHGMPPEELADIAFNGFQHESFYIHTHPDAIKIAANLRVKGITEDLKPSRHKLADTHRVPNKSKL